MRASQLTIAISQLFRISGTRADAVQGATPPGGSGNLSNEQAAAISDIQLTLSKLADRTNEQQQQLDMLLTRKPFNLSGKSIGIVFVAFGLAFLLMGTFRFFYVQHVLQHGKFPPARQAVLVASLGVTGLVAAACAAVFAIHPYPR